MKHIWETNHKAGQSAKAQVVSVWASAIATGVALLGEVLVWLDSKQGWKAAWLEEWVPFARWALIAAGVVSVVISRQRSKLGVRREERRAEVRSVSHSILRELSSLTGAPIEALGVSVWASVPLSRKERKSYDGDRVVLSRVDQTRLEQYPPPKNHVLRSGVGVVGCSWKSKATTYAGPNELCGKYDGTPLSKSEWRAVKNKWGFSRRDFPVQMARYSHILAVPMTDRSGKIFGCISLDLGAKHMETVTKFDSAEVRELLAQHAVNVYRALRVK